MESAFRLLVARFVEEFHHLALRLLGKFPEAYVDVLREMNNQSATIILGMFAHERSSAQA